MDGELSIRAAQPGDGPAVARVFGAAHALMTYLPSLHTAAEDVAFYSEVVAGHDGDQRLVEVAVAGRDDVVGFSALREDWLDHLYVEPAWQGRGVGSALLARAQSARPGGVQLWAFQANTGAQAFYARAGFVVAERTDGRGNEEKVPDVRMRWDG